MSSPIRSPFKNIANCVARVLQWSQSNESPNKGDQAFQEKSSDNHFESKSRSVSPEIPKLEEPTKYVMKDANKSGDKKSAATAMANQSRASTSRSSRNQTPRSAKKNSSPFTPKSNSKAANSNKVNNSELRRSRRKLPFDTDTVIVEDDKVNDKVVKTPRKSSRSSTPTVKESPSRRKSLRGGETVATKKQLEVKVMTPTKLMIRDSAIRRSTRVPSKVKNTKAKYDDSDEDWMTPNEKEDDSEDDSEDDFIIMTPKKPKSTPVKNSSPAAKKSSKSGRKQESSNLLKTPKRRKTSIEAVAHRDTPAKRRKTMTPRIPARSIPLAKDKSCLAEAQLRLHVGAVPDSLPCREDEFAQILSFTEGKIFDGTGGCMYISGVPGTGKTATVKEVIRTLKSYTDAGDLPEFQFIEINGMRLTEPNQAYTQLWKSLTGAKVTTEHAKNLLEKRFTTTSAARKQKTSVVLVDELDLLWNRKQSVLYNIFEWPNNKFSKLVVLAIANTMDLPERVMINRVSSRIGLTRLTFSPYTHQQLQEIVCARLVGLSIFDKLAIQLVSRKVASLSGDARRALDICRRATEIAESESSPEVSIAHVTDAHKEMFCSPKMMAIRSCSKYEKVFMQAMVAVFQKIGIEETPFDRVVHSMNDVLKFESLDTLSVDEAFNIVGRLSSSRLILSEPGKTGRLDMKLRLNVSQEDVLFALKPE